MDSPRIGVVGMGRLGTCMAAVFTDAGFDVTGSDVDTTAVDALNDGHSPPRVDEPGLDDMIERNHTLRVHAPATVDVAGMATESDVVFIVVPTPSGPDDRFNASAVCDAVRAVCVGFRDRARPSVPVIVITSTVMPGTCAGEITDVITAGGFDVGTTCGLVYGPEFIALGSVLHDLTHPDVVYLGSDDEWSAAAVASIYTRVAPDAPHMRLSLIDAEVAKLATNVYLSVKIGFANEVARLCESTPGADGSVVCAALGADRRIGAPYMRPGGPAFGPCLPRDVLAWETWTRYNGHATSRFAVSARMASEDVVAWAVDSVTESDAFADRDAVVAVLGLSYKDSTPVVERSLGWDVAASLAPMGRFVAVHDPRVVYTPMGCHTLPTLADTLEAASILVVATAHDCYTGLRPMGGQTIVDVWGICEPGDGVVIRPGRCAR